MEQNKPKNKKESMADKMKVGDIIEYFDFANPAFTSITLTEVDHSAPGLVKASGGSQSWVFESGEFPRFPIRFDVNGGRIAYDWGLAGRKPKVTELAIGDLVTYPDWDPSHDELARESSLPPSRLKVVKLKWARPGASVRLSVADPVGGTPRTWLVSLTEPIPPVKPIASAMEAHLAKQRPKAGKKIQPCGPYRHRKDGHIAYFLHKPYAGRWPTHSLPYLEEAIGEMREPETPSDWQQWDFVDGERSVQHPKDPALRRRRDTAEPPPMPQSSSAPLDPAKELMR